MAIVRYAVRRAKNRAERAQGKRWIAQAEFPGGRKITLSRSRTKPPAVTKLRQEVRNAVSQAANAGAVTISPAAQNSAGVAGYKRQQLRELEANIN